MKMFIYWVRQWLMKKVRKIIIKIVIPANDKLLLRPKFDEEKIVGIIKKIEKGFTIPPVK